MEWVEVSKEELDQFLAGYGKPLERDVTGICEPPMASWNDFSGGAKWPESMVAKAILYASMGDGEPNKYFIKAGQGRG